MGDTKKTVTIGGQDYEVRLDGDQLGDEARAALQQGRLDDGALTVAIEGVARALADRGA